jgi:hypothetical protein
MKIQYCSDLHLELESNSHYLNKQPLTPVGDILILAGDIIPLQDGFTKHPFFSYVADHFKEILWIPGNHEFYNQHVDRYGPSYTLAIKSNLRLVNNIDITIDGVRFVCTTLWSNIQPDNAKKIRQSVADFSCILLNNNELTTSGFNDLHSTSLQYLQNSIQQPNEPRVVITHHLPSRQCNSPIHNQSPINDAFCVELSETIKHSGVKFWIHGHSHFNYYPQLIGKTFLLTNQLGYVDHNEHTSFKHDAYFSV